MSFRHLTASAALVLAALVPLASQAAPKVKARPVVIAAPAPTPPAKETDWRTPNPDNLLVIDTTKGRIVVEMYPAIAPAHVARIQALAKRHFYDGQVFFRVIDEFMDQTGDPDNSGKGGSDLPNLKAEFEFKRSLDTPFVTATNSRGFSVGFMGALPVGSQSEDLMAMTKDGTVAAWPLFCTGVAAMARAGEADSANSQFFLMRANSPSLTRKYTGWGRVIAGQDAVNIIKLGEPPEDPDKMLTVRLASDMPVADRPKVQVLDTASATFGADLAKAINKDGSSFSACDMPIPTRGAAGGR